MPLTFELDLRTLDIKPTSHDAHRNPSTLIITYCNREEDVNAWIQKHVPSATSDPATVHFIGFDAEWRPTFKPKQYNPVALLQLSTRSHVLLFQVQGEYRIQKRRFSFSFPDLSQNRDLTSLLLRSDVWKVGVGASADTGKLYHDNLLRMSHVYDLMAAAKMHYDICLEEVLGKELFVLYEACKGFLSNAGQMRALHERLGFPKVIMVEVADVLCDGTPLSELQQKPQVQALVKDVQFMVALVERFTLKKLASFSTAKPNNGPAKPASNDQADSIDQAASNDQPSSDANNAGQNQKKNAKRKKKKNDVVAGDPLVPLEPSLSHCEIRLPRERFGLKSLIPRYTSVTTLSKARISTTNWETCPLSLDQIRYASIDAWGSTEVLHILVERLGHLLHESSELIVKRLKGAGLASKIPEMTDVTPGQLPRGVSSTSSRWSGNSRKLKPGETPDVVWISQNGTQ